MRGINNDDITAGVHDGSHTRLALLADANGCANAKPATLVSGGVGILLGLLDVPDGNETL